ncbi:hypothetical protein WT59_11505 [Burkholderia territorii]|nr:hypothetical protein WT59_11505 [Burkholderia territorii]
MSVSCLVDAQMRDSRVPAARGGRTASADRMSCAGRFASARDIRNMQHEPGFRVAHLNEIEHARRTFE